MTVVLAPFPDVERAVGDLVADLGTPGSETNITLQSTLPYIRIRRLGGSDDRITDAARVDVHVYDTDATNAKAIAETIRQRLISGPSTTTHGVIDRVWTEVGPQTIPAADTANIRQVVATYRVSMRRR
jgi:hypothetical protein